MQMFSERINKLLHEGEVKCFQEIMLNTNFITYMYNSIVYHGNQKIRMNHVLPNNAIEISKFPIQNTSSSGTEVVFKSRL